MFVVARSSSLLATVTPRQTRVNRRRVGIAKAAENEIRCYVNEEGHLVCDRLEPGDYVVKQVQEETKEETEKPPEGAAFCYITDSGELICEGLPEGNYTIEQATEEHMSDMLSHMERLTKETEVIAEPKEEISPTAPQETFDPETGVRCYVNSDGVMVCEKLEPGDYKVKPLTKPKAEVDDKANDGVMFCYITDNGELLCEGMEEGQYTIEKATDEDLADMLKHVEGITKPSE